MILNFAKRRGAEREQSMKRSSAIALAAGSALLAAIGTPVLAQQEIPRFGGGRPSLTLPNLSALPRLRFLTTTDFFPFNFLDSEGRLTGFHVDLARAICRELEIEEKCQIQALPFEELAQTLENGGGEAIMAGFAITEDSRREFLFSRSYLQFPARFLTRREERLSEPVREKIAGKRIGVMAETAHEMMLRDFFPDASVVTYTREDWLFGDLQEGKVAAAFGDGLRFSFWLTDDASEACCVFSGGPYLAPEYLGHGLAIAVPLEQQTLAGALDNALEKIEASGTFEELYLRYFPINFYGSRRE